MYNQILFPLQNYLVPFILVISITQTFNILIYFSLNSSVLKCQVKHLSIYVITFQPSCQKNTQGNI